MNFDEFHLDSEILSGVKRKGFSEPTPIQHQSIPEALNGHDVLGLAQTGTGKTAAFLLPVIQKIHKDKSRHIKSLVVVPTRELAEQVYQDALEFASGTRVRISAIYGGVSKFHQTRALRQGVDLVIGCPGRLLDHMRDGNLRLDKLDILVLDEADTMCDMGFLPDVSLIIEDITQPHQTLFYSATMPKEIRDLSMQILNNPKTIQVDALAPANTVSHSLYPITPSLKKPLLFSLIKQTPTGKVLVFTRTKYKAKEIASDLKREGHKTAELQGNMSQSQRQHSMNGFRRGRYDILVATDIAAHGIDVTDVTHVINFDMPGTVDDYTHRIGRTGRATNQGEAFTLAVRADAQMVKSVEKLLGESIERRRLPDFDYGSFYPEDQFSQGSPKSKTRSPNPRKASAKGTSANTDTRRRKPSGGPRGAAENKGSQNGSNADRRPPKTYRNSRSDNNLENFTTHHPNSRKDRSIMQDNDRNQNNGNRTSRPNSNSRRTNNGNSPRNNEQSRGPWSSSRRSDSSSTEPRFIGRHTRSKHASSSANNNRRRTEGGSTNGSQLTSGNMFLGKKSGPKQQNQRRGSSSQSRPSSGRSGNSNRGQGPSRRPNY